VLVVSLTALRPIVSTALAGWAYDNSAALRVPFVSELVRERYAEALTTPAGSDSSDVTFTIEPGDDVKSVAARLEDEGLVNDARAFIFQATMRRLAERLTAGNFRLARSMTPDGIVTGLIENRIVITIVSKTFRESLRVEQMATLIQTWESGLSVDGNEFREIVTDPPADLLAHYPWLKTSGLPDGASLEGYLFPSTYDLRPETTTEDLIRMMLDKFVEEVGADPLADPKFYQSLTLASIVEREAKVESERPLIAGTYKNRLNSKGSGQLLNADPTVFYALDTLALREKPFEEWVDYTFWEPPGVALADVPLPPDLEKYNTYRNRGLPPGPICSPGITSINAALSPDTKSGFLFFVAIPDGNGAHDFSKTLEEHQDKLRKYGYQ
jgi:UPF0755 protein